MKIIQKMAILVALLYVHSFVNAQGSIGIGTNTPDARAKLDITATDAGILIPRLNTVQINALTALGSIPDGLLIYNSDTKTFQYWDSSLNSGTGDWNAIKSESEAQDWTRDSVNGRLYSTNTSDNIGVGTNVPTHKLEILGGDLSVREDDDGANAVKLGATNTGGWINMYEDAILTNKLSTNGDSYIRGGDFGLGTTNPSDKLEILDGDFSVKEDDNGNSAAKIGATDTGGWMDLYQDGTRMNRIDAQGDNYITGGDFGLGTTNPSHLLEVLNGEISLREDDNENDALEFGATNTGGWIDMNQNGTRVNRLDAEGDSYLTGGDFGVGTTNPSNLLEVLGGDIVLREDDNSDNAIKIEASNTGGAIEWLGFSGRQHYIDAVGPTVFNQQGMNIDFRIEGDNEDFLFYVDANEDAIGVGTNTPKRTLHVMGTPAMGEMCITPAAAGGSSRLILAEDHLSESGVIVEYNGLTNSLSFNGFTTSGGTVMLEDPIFEVSRNGDFVSPPEGYESERIYLSPADFFCDSTSTPSYSAIQGYTTFRGNVYTTVTIPYGFQATDVYLNFAGNPPATVDMYVSEVTNPWSSSNACPSTVPSNSQTIPFTAPVSGEGKYITIVCDLGGNTDMNLAGAYVVLDRL